MGTVFRKPRGLACLRWGRGVPIALALILAFPGQGVAQGGGGHSVHEPPSAATQKSAPDPGERAAAQTRQTPRQTVEVPDLAGLATDAAVQMLHAVGLVPDPFRFFTLDQAQDGLVDSSGQDPSPGTQVAPGSSVKFFYAEYVDPDTDTPPSTTTLPPPPLGFTGSGAASVTVEENSLGDIGDYSATAYDGSDVTYSLSGADAAAFGVFVDDEFGLGGLVYNKRVFDFEDPGDKTLEFTVEATIGAGTLSKDVTVTVGDVNDNPEFTSGAFVCRLAEGAAAGAACGSWPSVVAADDDGDSLSYSLSDASPLAEYLDVDPATGAATLSAVGAGRLDADTYPEFRLSLWVSDNKDADGNPDAEIDDRAAIRVVVEHMAPSLSSLHVQDRSEAMSVIWTVSPAQARQYQVQYRVVGAPDWVDHDLTAAGALKDHVGKAYSEIHGLYADTPYEMRWCEGTACAGGSYESGGTLRTEAKEDLNAPADIGRVWGLSVAENSAPGARAGRVYGHSGDGDKVRDLLRFWLEGTGSENFAVTTDGNGAEAQITTTAALDHETAASYTLTLHVSDDRSATGAVDPSSDDSRQVTIAVTDVVERPDSPILTAATTGTDSVTLTWTAPSAGDRPISGYRVEYRQPGDAKWGHTRHIDGTTVTIGGLAPGTVYQFRGIAVTAGRPPTWSDWETAPKLVITTEGDSAAQTAPEPETPKTTVTATTLPPETAEQEPESAQQAAEPEPAPEVVDPEPVPEVVDPEPVPEVVDPEPPLAPPAAPRSLRASAGSGSVTLNWDAPDDPSVSGYRILRKLFGSNAALQVYVANTGSSAATFTDSAVAAGTRYVYRVKAINAAGVGDRSNYVRITPG